MFLSAIALSISRLFVLFAVNADALIQITGRETVPVRDDLLISDSPYDDSGFVGRKSELFQLGSALDRARSGSGGVWLLSGEAGVGKTRLAMQFSAYARVTGAKVLMGRANQRFRDTLPFGVWNQIVAYQPDPNDGRPSKFIECDSYPALVPSPQRFADSQPHAVAFEMTARALVEHARTQPLVLVLDDLYAADSLSLQAFRMLARELSRCGTLVIGIYRNSEIKRFPEFADFLVDPSIRDSKRIALAGFDEIETSEFVQSRIVGPPDERTQQTLLALTGGNPRLLDIALRHDLLDVASHGSGKWLSGLLRLEIEAHLEHLSAQAKEVLSTASLSGSEFRLPVLAHVLEQGPAELLDSIQEAEQTGLLRQTEDPGTYRFRRTLVQEILRSELTGIQRARLHKRFAEVLEGLYPHNDAFVERIANHFYEGALIGCAEKAAEYCLRAAAQARSGSRVDDALRFYQMALVALEFQGSDPVAIRHLKAKLDHLSSHRASGASPAAQPPETAGSAWEAAESAVQNQAGNEAHKNSSQASLGRGVLSLRGEVLASFPSARTQRGLDGADSVVERALETCLPTLEHSVAQPRSEVGKNTFRRERDFWTLTFEERVLLLQHSNGLVFVAHLLQHPDGEFHVAQLIALLPSAKNNHAQTVHLSRRDKERLGLHDVGDSDSNPLLDAKAKAEYRRRIDDLRDALEHAKEFNDASKVAELEKELEFIALDLSRVVGLGGRDRGHRAEEERARVNVTNAIRALTAKIAKEHPSFGRYLRLTIRTGRFCAYRPDPQSTPHWEF